MGRDKRPAPGTRPACYESSPFDAAEGVQRRLEPGVSRVGFQPPSPTNHSPHVQVVGVFGERRAGGTPWSRFLPHRTTVPPLGPNDPWKAESHSGTLPGGVRPPARSRSGKPGVPGGPGSVAAAGLGTPSRAPTPLATLAIAGPLAFLFEVLLGRRACPRLASHPALVDVAALAASVHT